MGSSSSLQKVKVKQKFWSLAIREILRLVNSSSIMSKRTFIATSDTKFLITKRPIENVGS